MEIVLGILLLFGAFTLGAVTSGSDDSDTDTAQIETDVYGHHEQAVATLKECQASGSAVTYRDLTIPYIQHIQRSDQKTTSAGDCEVNCWDE